MTRHELLGSVGAMLVVLLAATIALAGVLTATAPLRADAVAGGAPSTGDSVVGPDQTAELVESHPDRLARVDRLVDDYNDHLDGASERIRDRFADDPATAAAVGAAFDLVRGRLADQRIEVRVATGDGDAVFVATTDEEARVTGYELGEGDGSAGLRIRTDEATIRDIRNAADGPAAVVEAYRSGAIRIEGDGFEAVALDRTVRFALDTACGLGLC
ncbi:hypothetical protein [Halomarina litorea]|uniref:hypothetical protein n=1 Tax=Halomarina litorea TaxID=2961595 RepID=UPI0020C3A19F|nr:hypothetical protein [Halomarina sp. BCD28]